MYIYFNSASDCQKMETLISDYSLEQCLEIEFDSSTNKPHESDREIDPIHFIKMSLPNFELLSQSSQSARPQFLFK